MSGNSTDPINSVPTVKSKLPMRIFFSINNNINSTNTQQEMKVIRSALADSTLKPFIKKKLFRSTVSMTIEALPKSNSIIQTTEVSLGTGLQFNQARTPLTISKTRDTSKQLSMHVPRSKETGKRGSNRSSILRPPKPCRDRRGIIR
jgi:hypothetical protein